MAVLITNQDDKLVFLHIAKCGGTSVREWLSANTKHIKLGDKHDTILELEQKGFTVGKHFTIVRNPYARLHSWFYYHVQEMNRYRHKLRPHLDNWVEWEKKGFQEYIMSDVWKLGDIGKLQTEYFRSDVLKVVRLENITTEWQCIMDLLNISVPLHKTNVSDHSDNFINEYTTIMKHKVAEYYKKDFERLGYTI